MALAAAVFLIWRHATQSGFDAALFAQSLRALDWWWLPPASAAALGTYYLRAVRWRVFLEQHGSPCGVWTLTKATAIGFAAINLLGRPGEFVRPYLIARACQTTVASQLATLVLERVYDLMGALMVFGIGLSRVDHSAAQAGERLGWVLHRGGQLVAGLVAASVAFLLITNYYRHSFVRFGLAGAERLPARWQAAGHRLVHALVEGISSTRSSAAVLRVLGWTAIEWLLIVLANFFLFRSFGDTLPLGVIDVVIFTGFLAFGAVIQIPGIGGGLQVMSVLVLMELFEAPLEIASSFTLVLWLLTFTIIVPVGMVLALREGLSWASLRHVKDEVT